MRVPDHLRDRRDLARRATRRRRLLVVGGLVAITVAAVLVLTGAFSHAGSGEATRSAGTPDQPRAVARTTETPATPATTPTPASGTYRGPIPILMYHVVTAPKAGETYPELWTPRERFAATMDLLAQRGYRGVTIEQVRRTWDGGPGLPAKPIVVTFDDGYLSQYTHAKPVLRRLGWPGVLYLEGKNLGPGGLTTRQVKAMVAAGWEVGAHTLTHPDLTTVDDARLTQELEGSRALLRERLGVPVTAFCYPAGRNDARVRAAVKAAGFTTATTVEPGIASPKDDPFALPRIRVNGDDGPQTVLDRVRTGAGATAAYGG